MLEGKTAIVTGASRGIGRAIALELAGKGAYVVVNYNGSGEAADEVVKAIETAGGQAEAYQCNVADGEACEKLINDVIGRHGRIDILVNNAGITRDNLLMRMSEEDFDAVLGTNLKGAFHTMHFASRYMLKQRSGRIINMASVVGVAGNAGQANYAASKAGVIGMTKSAAKELASRGITVNAVAPGVTRTDMVAALPEATVKAISSRIPLGRAGEPEEVANAFLYLASDLASYVTGEILSVDGASKA